MITKQAKKKIKKELKKLGKSYADTILQYLNENNITNEKGHPYSESMIRAILNRPITHLKLEKAIYACFDKVIKENKREAARRRELESQVK